MSDQVREAPTADAQPAAGAGLQDGHADGSTTGSAESTERSGEKLGWRKQLRQEYWDNEEAARFNNPSELMQAYLEQLGKTRAPASPQEYRLPEVDGAPDGMRERVAEFAHKVGMTNEQAAAFYEANVQTLRNQAESERERVNKITGDLKKQLGSEYDERVGAVVNMLSKLGAKAAAKSFKESPGKAGPELASALVQLAELISEDSIESGRPGRADGEQRSFTTNLPMLHFKGPSKR